MCNSCHMGRYLLTHLLLLFILFHLAEYIINGSDINANVSCVARLNMTDGVEWWTLTQNSRYVLSNEPPGVHLYLLNVESADRLVDSTALRKAIEATYITS